MNPDLQSMIAGYQAGKSFAELAAESGVPKTTIRRWLRPHIASRSLSQSSSFVPPANKAAWRKNIAAAALVKAAEKWERRVLADQGLSDWTVEYAADGYCWLTRKVIQTVAGDKALFLHEVAHALTPPSDGDQHNSWWAANYTRLVREYLTQRRASRLDR